jgi:hypothetical protein
MEPDLGVLGNPWIDDAMMEWSNQAIALRASVEVVSHSLDRSKGEGGYCRQPKEAKDTPDLQVHESCDIGVIGMTKGLEGLEKVSAICEENPLVPQEDNRCETMDLPVAECPPSPIEFPIVKFFNRAPKPMFGRVAEAPMSVLDHAVGSMRFLEGLETCYDASTTHILRFKSLSAVGTYKEGQGSVDNADRVERLTLVDTVHLEHPPGNVLMFVEPPTVGIIDPGVFAPETMRKSIGKSLPFLTNVSVDCIMFIEGTETVGDEWIVLVAIVHHFEPSWAIRTYGKDQVVEKSLERGGGLTLDDIGHLLRPPGWVIECRW